MNVPLGLVLLPVVLAPEGEVKAHELALDDQLRVVEVPLLIVEGAALNETVGAGGGGLTLTVLVLLAEATPLVHVKV